ncbi:hypothetical protein [Pseudorhizobium flavum]|uniref:Uncharacterized protein n=1 Tax=Pseudorhizobium flavum TaxID=1335061 RepID=A0A7W9YXJ0_9HYPH|nr:hypothetical protein [Pseudorhizobium flavum]MBB6179834.1 hypothetical protein [Pseudorhizobium flavum]CAD6597074.1 hypothetical protein RFYW14_00452 [Pseudorhizobium flavum]
MSAPLKLPPFGKFLDALQTAGVNTRTARGFWGGVADDGQLVVTSWTDANDGKGRFSIFRPLTNHGGLKTQWDVGNIRVGTEVRLILLRQRGNEVLGEGGRTVKDAVLMPGMWRVVETTFNEMRHRPQAFVEPVSASR